MIFEMPTLSWNAGEVNNYLKIKIKITKRGYSMEEFNKGNYPTYEIQEFYQT